MPFCCQCGCQVGQPDIYCAACGARQPQSASETGWFASTSSQRAAALCYVPVLGWIAAIVILASARFRGEREVRFHAFQGLYLFVTWLIIDWGLGPAFSFRHVPWMPFSLVGALKVALFAVWIFMIVKTSQGQKVRLPVLSDLAERSISEQK